MATSTFGPSRRVLSSAIAEIQENAVFWAYRAHFCVDFDDPNRPFMYIFECEVYFSEFSCFHLLFFVVFVKLTWFFDFLYQKRE